MRSVGRGMLAWVSLGLVVPKHHHHSIPNRKRYTPHQPRPPALRRLLHTGVMWCGSRLFFTSLALTILSHATYSQMGRGDVQVRVLTLNGDGELRGNTWAEYKATVAVTGDYTLCLRFNIIVFRLLTAVIYILDKKEYDLYPISLDVYFEKIRPKYGGYGRFYALPTNLATNKWYYYCQVRNSTGGEGLVYLDGELIVHETVTFEIDEAVRDTIMGQDEFMPPYSMSGQLSQVNMWRRILSPEEILSLSRCEMDLEGDIISWSGPWKLFNVEETYVPLKELCGSMSRGRLTVPLPLLRYHDAVQLCRGLRGFIDAPTTMEEVMQTLACFKDMVEDNRWTEPDKEGEDNSTTFASTKEIVPLYQGCERQWGGVDDEAVEGVWHNPFTDVRMAPSELAFRKHNPDGDKYQNCLLIRDKGLLDTDCKKHSCSACHTTAGNTWTLRGTCEEEERMFYFDLVAVPMSFRGYGEYRVEKVKETWAWRNAMTNTTVATLPPLTLNYPVGRLHWDLKEPVCGQEEGQRMLTLSACVPGEFTCDDGSCIPFSKRCDLKFDCNDKTDESFCDIVNFPDDYRSRLPPRPVSVMAETATKFSQGFVTLQVTLSRSFGEPRPTDWEPLLYAKELLKKKRSAAARASSKYQCDAPANRFCHEQHTVHRHEQNSAASDESLPIAVSVSMDTVSIDTTTMLLSVSYNLRMTWLDNRLTYNNLKPLTRLNTVSQEQVEQLWRPEIGFINTDDIQQTQVDEDAVTTVYRKDGQYTPDLASPYEVEIYRGDTNPLSTSRKYFTIYTCNFDLVLYPFDIQECYLRLKIISASFEYLIFNVTDSTVEYLGQKFLVEYGIGRIDLREDDGGQYSEAQVRVELIRRYGFAMLNIYIPSLTLLIISYVTLYFRPSIFEVRVMTALTSLLVLATLFTQVSASLPKTSYFKMVDIWLLFCIILIFFIIIFHTIIDLKVDYGTGFFSHSSPSTKNSSRSKGVTRVSPIASADRGDAKDFTGLRSKLVSFKPDLNFYIMASRYTIFSIFLLFNVIYWGTLARKSGLVYYY